MPEEEKQPNTESLNTVLITENTAPQKKVIGRPFPKGVSGNPAGKPKGTKHLSSLLKQALNDKEDVEIKDKDGNVIKRVTFAEALIHRLKKIVINGEDKEAIKAIAETFDRAEGKARGSMNIGFDEEVKEIKTIIVHKTIDDYNRDRDIGEERTEPSEDNG